MDRAHATVCAVLSLGELISHTLMLFGQDSGISDKNNTQPLFTASQILLSCCFLVHSTILISINLKQYISNASMTKQALLLLSLTPIAPLINGILVITYPNSHNHNNQGLFRWQHESYTLQKYALGGELDRPIANNESKFWQWTFSKINNNYYLPFIIQSCFYSILQSIISIILVVFIFVSIDNSNTKTDIPLILLVSIIISIVNVIYNSILLCCKVFLSFNIDFLQIWCWICCVLDYLASCLLLLWLIPWIDKFSYT